MFLWSALSFISDLSHEASSSKVHFKVPLCLILLTRVSKVLTYHIGLITQLSPSGTGLWMVAGGGLICVTPRPLESRSSPRPSGSVAEGRSRASVLLPWRAGHQSGRGRGPCPAAGRTPSTWFCRGVGVTWLVGDWVRGGCPSNKHPQINLLFSQICYDSFKFDALGQITHVLDKRSLQMLMSSQIVIV